MDQIRQILKQLALHLELNIAMCDMLDDHSKRIKALESHCEAQKSRVDGLYRLVSEANYVAASKAYEGRRASMRSQNAESKNTSEDK